MLRDLGLLPINRVAAAEKAHANPGGRTAAASKGVYVEDEMVAGPEAVPSPCRSTHRMAHSGYEG